jgi:hypothetical protein
MDKACGCGGGYRKMAEQSASKGSKCHPEKDGEKREVSPEEKQKMMIRELQGVFCKGRYRSWVLR